LWGSPKNDLKICESVIYNKHFPYGHLARPIQKVCKIMENAKCEDIKFGFFTVVKQLECSTVTQSSGLPRVITALYIAGFACNL
jgi:hypothetical protein